MSWLWGGVKCLSDQWRMLDVFGQLVCYFCNALWWLKHFTFNILYIEGNDKPILNLEVTILFNIKHF